jgi:hypothetical protein
LRGVLPPYGVRLALGREAGAPVLAGLPAPPVLDEEARQDEGGGDGHGDRADGEKAGGEAGEAGGEDGAVVEAGDGVAVRARYEGDGAQADDDGGGVVVAEDEHDDEDGAQCGDRHRLVAVLDLRVGHVAPFESTLARRSLP